MHKFACREEEMAGGGPTGPPQWGCSGPDDWGKAVGDWLAGPKPDWSWGPIGGRAGHEEEMWVVGQPAPPLNGWGVNGGSVALGGHGWLAC